MAEGSIRPQRRRMHPEPVDRHMIFRIWELIQLSGSLLVSGSKTGELLVWDATADTEDRTVTTRHHPVHGSDRLTFAPDGSSIFLAQVPDGQVIEWAGESFREKRVVRPPGPAVRAMLFEPNGWRLTAGLENGSIEWFDLREPMKSEVLSCEEGSLEPLGFNVKHSGLWVRHTGRSRVEEWVFGEQGPRRAFPSDHSERRVCWLAPGHGVLSITEDDRFLFLEEHSGEVVPWELPRDLWPGGSFSPDLRWLAVPHEPGAMTVWDVREALSGSGPPQRRATLTGALLSYHQVIFTPDSRRVAASSGLSQLVTLWDTESFEAVLTLAGKGWGTLQIAFSPDGNTLISGGDLLHIWAAPSWEEIAAAEAR